MNHHFYFTNATAFSDGSLGFFISYRQGYPNLFSIDSGTVTFCLDGQPVHSEFIESQTIAAQQTDNPKTLRLQLFSMPAGFHVDDFLLIGNEALDAPEIESLTLDGMQAFLKSRPAQL